ncbi:MAG: transposase family protein, partial [Mesoflavibacter sp.]|nr:transposase family protein [Mesoflavibacter sp.]
VVGTAVPDQKATTLAYALINHVFCRVGPAKVILSDLGQNLLSAVFKEMCKFFGIKRIYTTAYNPKGNGAIEKFHHTLDDLLSAMARHVPENWDHYLQPALFAYRTTPHSATGVSPFLLSLGRQPNLPTQSIFGRDPIDTDPITVFDYLANLESTLKTVYNKAGINIKQAQAASKKKYDFSAKEDQWEVGDVVW